MPDDTTQDRLPSIKAFRYQAIGESPDNVAVMTGLASVMDDHGKNLSTKERDAIAHWFFKNYATSEGCGK